MHTVRNFVLTAVVYFSVNPAVIAQNTQRQSVSPSKPLQVRVRAEGLPPDAGIFPVTVQVEASGEIISRSIPAGVTRAIIAPGGLLTVSGDTVLIRKDSIGPAYYAPVENAQITIPDTNVAVVRYAPITGILVVRYEGGPADLMAGSSVQHQCVQKGSCAINRGETFAAENLFSMGGSTLLIAPAVPGMWFIRGDQCMQQGSTTVYWCPRTATPTVSVVPGKITTVVVRMFKRTL